MKFRLFLLSLPFLFMACQKGYQHHDMGFDYKIYSSSKSPAIKAGSYLEGSQSVFLVRDNKADSLLEPNQPFQLKLDSSLMGKSAPYMYNAVAKILLDEGKADSLSVIAPADSIKANAPFLKKGDKVRFDIKIKKVLDEAGFKKKTEEEDQKKEDRRLEMVSTEGKETRKQLIQYTEMLKKGSKVAAKDSAEIEKWLKSKNIKNAHRTPSGLYYIVNEPGSGDSILPFQKVKVDYTGRLLDGTGFDSSAIHGPYEFMIGDERSAIMGWQEGMMYFKKGGSGKLIIPSYLGYGEQGAGEDIPANSPLVFDIKILEVK
jgi:FKBP-type peptidyl-prolyl cis-trans isomerase